MSVDVKNGQKTGYFLDQKENRFAIRRYAKGGRVLDWFCNSGGFSLNVQDETMAKTGAFVQDKDDTGKVSGYFINWNVYPNNIGKASQ